MSGTVGDNIARASGVIASAGGGTILSAKSLAFLGSASRSGALGAITSFDMSFAPTKSDSKLYFQVCLGSSTCSTGSQVSAFYFYDVTNTTIIGSIGGAAGSRVRVSFKHASEHKGYDSGRSWGCWHEPGSTDSRDYTIYGSPNSGTLYINTNHYNYDVTDMDSARPASTFTITEYAASAVTLT